MLRQTNPLPQLTLPRAQRALARLGAEFWSSRQAVVPGLAPILSSFLPITQAQRQTFRPLTRPRSIGPANGAWKTRWLKIAVPAAKPSERGLRHLLFDCQGEATAYWQGKPWAGLDPAHKSCPLPDQAGTLYLELGLWQTGIWVPGAQGIGAQGALFASCAIGVRDPAIWKAYWDLDGLLQALKVYYEESGRPWQTWSEGHRAALESCPPLLRRVLGALEDACDALDHGGVSAFATSVSAAYRAFPAESWQPEAVLCGHAHIDLVWLWPEGVTESKGVHTMANQLRLLERYPEYRFTQSQPALYRAIERRAPRLYREVQQQIKRGRWEAMGALEVAPDNNLPCGESLVRSLWHGQAKLAQLRGGKPSPLCWIPDVFGYSGALPQILKLGGVEHFYTTKMSWSQVTKFPYTSFVWKGLDGSEVLTHLGTAGYNGSVEAWRLQAAIKEHRQAAVHPEMLMPTGWGDGGGGATEELLERARRLKSLAGLPRTRWSKAEPFFDRLEKKRSKLPVYQGELYLEFHRGTYTTQGAFKHWHRALERNLQAHEAVRVLSGGGPLPAEQWQRLAFCAFHDALPGSSIAQVYRELGGELETRATTALQSAQQELKQALGRGNTWQAFNPVALPRTKVMVVPGLGLQALQLPALASTSIQTHAPVAPVQATLRRLDNGLVRADFDAKGQLQGLRDAQGELALAGPAGFVLYPDQPAAFDAWDIDQSALKKGVALSALTNWKLVEKGPLRSRLRGQARLGAKSRLTVNFVLDAGSRWLQIEVEAEWREQHRLLKYHVPTQYQGREALFGAPFGSIKRPQLPGTEREEAQWEVPGSRWAAVLGEDGQGLAMVTEAKYGFSCRQGNLGLSLLRAPSDPDPQADQGRHLMRFSLGRHYEASRGQQLSSAAEAEALYAPVLLAKGSKHLSAPFSLGDLGTLLPSWVLPCHEGQGSILRLHETAGHSGSVQIHLSDFAARVDLVDFLERKFGSLKAVNGILKVPYKPYQILSLRFG